MPHNSTRAGQTVTRVKINDEPHERYREHDPWTGKAIEPGIPILTKTPKGNIVDKEVTHKEVKCPECDVPATYDEEEEPVCPECGIIPSGGNSEITQKIVIDAKAAGRIDSETDETEA